MRSEVDDECARSLERGSIDESIHLSRRHRWKPLAMDSVGDVAVIVVAERGKRFKLSIEARLMERRDDGSWTPVSSHSMGSGSSDPALPSRSNGSRRTFDVLIAGVRGRSCPSRFVAVRRRPSFRVLLVASNVAAVEFRAQRRTVPEHGFVCLMWDGASRSDVRFFDSGGVLLDVLTRDALRVRRAVLLSRRLPVALRIAVWTNHRRRTFSSVVDWFNYRPLGPLPENERQDGP